MRRMILTAVTFAGLMLAVCAGSWHAPRAHAQNHTPVMCCGKKPTFSDPAYSSVFTGQVAVTTRFAGLGTDFVLSVIDLKNQSTAPIDTGPPTYSPAMYHGPAGAEWTKSRLGTIFGLTLDNQGNIYTTATTAYDGDFFPASTSTGGEIYKIDGVTGTISVFQTLPNTGHAGLGNINYDCVHNNFYVSNVDDGLIYRLNTNGNILSTWDHGANLPTAIPPSTAIPDFPSQVYTPRGRLAWGIQANNGRFYYAEWPKSSQQQTEVWSVGLLSNGDFTGSAKREISVPIMNGYATSVADISFGPTGTMLLAERSMNNETDSDAHRSRALEYTLVGPIWTLLNPTKFQFNANPATPQLANSCAGGVDYDFGPNGRVWVTGDVLHFGNPDLIYGIEGLPAAGGNASNSILLSSSGIADFHKYEIGDVEIPCPLVVPPSCKAEFAASTVCPGQATTFTDLSSGASSWNWNFGDGSNSTQQNPTHVYAIAGSYSVTLSVNGGACTVTHTVIVSAAPSPPVISGPATTCLPGIYSIPPQPGATITWSVTNGGPASGTGASINVTWNPTGNGLVVVTLTNSETCCKTTAQLIVHPCDTSGACCEGMNVNAVFKSFVAVGGGVYTFTPTLTAGPVNITHVSATVISSSLTFSPTFCGTNGPVNSYITSATSPVGFSFSLPVQFSRDVTWTASSSAGVNISGGLAFPFNIQFPSPPGSPCKDNLTFCIKYTFTNVNCKSCEIIRCYGPFPRSGGIDIPTGSN